MRTVGVSGGYRRLDTLGDAPEVIDRAYDVR
jgi:hypothetical protein